MKHILLFLLLCPCLTLPGQSRLTVHGTVTSALDNAPLAGVNITIKGTTRGTVSDANGAFELNTSTDDVLIFSFIGYETQEVPLEGRTRLSINLYEDVEMLNEVAVYSTGYQELPAERATGSFEHIDNELLNRSVSTDVISRLEGVTNGLLFDTRINPTPGSTPPQLRIRGLSTMYGEGFGGTNSTKESPLIVVDNFPYEGDINNINPNDVESITVLKDAAAASIWGARAGNGVIVITTKKGKLDQPVNISFNSNITISQKPDLFYSLNFLEAEQFVEVQEQLFNQGFFMADENDPSKPALSEAVELMIMERDGMITSNELQIQLASLKQQDVRREAHKYLYRSRANQQYSLNVKGGGETLKYYVSGGYDKDLSEVNGDQSERITFNTNNSFNPLKDLELTIGMYYTQKLSQANGMDLRRLQTYNRSPYLQLADANGNPLSIPYEYRSAYIDQAEDDGLLDWHYYPLKERDLNDDKIKDKENRFNVALNYSITPGLAVNIKYQYQNLLGERTILTDKDAYAVRNLVNRFTQADGTYIFPYGDMLTSYNRESEAHLGRAQVNYSRIVNTKHTIAALAGVEVRELNRKQHSFELYGYDDDILTYQTQFDYITRYPVRPRGTSRISTPNHYLDDYLDRFISYYSNASYTYNERYIFTSSLRWDASNLFGVKTNQKGVPLWSAGGSWLVNNETFYNIPWLPLLKLRATYGFAGNIDKSATAYPTATYGADKRTDLPYARLRSPGNPQLRWEKVNTINTAVDFAMRHNRVKGSIEYYRKNSSDLIAPIPLDPTTGFLDRYNVNYASLIINGVDLEVNTNYKLGPVNWQAGIFFNYVKDEVTDFQYDGDGNPTWYTQGNITLPVVGRPLYTMYSYPWVGLEPATGNPLVNLEGQLSTDYSAYYNQLDPAEDLVPHGPKVPPFFGALRNTFNWKGFSISANITWKAGYYFRRSAMDYYQLFYNSRGHTEFNERWMEPGDEEFTNVPSMPEIANSNRDRIYILSELTVEKGDHVRLQDVNLSYELLQSQVSNLPVDRVRIYLYARNLGILWSANKRGLDPDYPSSLYPPAKSFSVGVQVDF